MCNLFTMELNLIVCNVTIKQLRNKVFDNMCDLFILEFNIVVRNVVIRQLGNKTINNICNLFTMELNIVVCNVTIRQLRNKDFNSITIGYARYRVCTCFYLRQQKITIFKFTKISKNLNFLFFQQRFGKILFQVELIGENIKLLTNFWT